MDGVAAACAAVGVHAPEHESGKAVPPRLESELGSVRRRNCARSLTRRIRSLLPLVMLLLLLEQVQGIDASAERRGRMVIARSSDRSQGVVVESVTRAEGRIKKDRRRWLLDQGRRETGHAVQDRRRREGDRREGLSGDAKGVFARRRRRPRPIG